MRVLVTGVAGCLGSRVAEGLVRGGFEVICIYRKRRPIIRGDFHVQLLQCDLAEGRGLPDRYDAVFHAAASSPGAGVTIAEMAHDNIEATRQLIAHARSSGATHFVFCSSLSIYGRIGVGEVDESTPVCDPDAYGLTKLVGEALIAEASRNLSTLSLRLPAVLGPGASRNFLATAAAKLSANEPVVIFNPDADFNNAVHGDDIAALAASLFRHSWRGPEAIVLGAGGVITIQSAIERLRTKLDSSSPITIRNPPKPTFLLNSSRAKERFGYSPMSIDVMLDQYAKDVLAGAAVMIERGRQ